MWRQMRFLALCLFVSLMVFSSFALGAEEVNHPYLNSQEFKNGISEIQQLQGKIAADDAEIAGLSQRISTKDLSFYGTFFSILAFIGVDMSLIGLVISTILIIVYIRYLKKHNPLKWFILFKSHHNFTLVLNGIRRVSKNILPMLLMVCLLQAGPAWADGLKAAQLSMSQDPLAKTLTLLTCGEKGQGTIDTGLDKVKEFSFYRKVKYSSYEHLYDVLVLYYVLDIPVSPEDFKNLLSICPPDELGQAYNFIFSIGNFVLVRNVVQQRLMSLIMGSGKNDIDKAREIALIYEKSLELNKLQFIKDDLLAVCDASHFRRNKISLLYLAYIAMDLDLEKFNTLWSAIKNEFPTFAGDRELRNALQEFLIKAAAKQELGPLYDAPEFLKLISFLNNKQKIHVTMLFYKPRPDLAKSVIESISFDNLQFQNIDDALAFSTAVKNLVPEKVPDLVKRLAEMVVYAGSVPFKQIRVFFRPLSIKDDSIIDALVQADLEIHGDTPGKSKWITAELLTAASPESRRKHFDFLQKRYGAYKNILTGLHAVDQESFYKYLDFMYMNHGADLANLEFGNNLYSFTAWRQGPIPLWTNDISKLPWNIFLLHYEAATANPDSKKLNVLLTPIDSILSEYSCNSAVVQNKFPDFLIYYQATTGSKDPELGKYNQALALILEKEIKRRLEKTKSDLSQKVQESDAQRERLKAQLSQIRWEKAKAIARFIALAILLLIQFVYVLAAFLLSLKYAFHLLIERTAQRVALFIMIFLETFAKFLLPTLILFPMAVAIIFTVQAFALLCGRGTEFPTITKAVETYQQLVEMKQVQPEPTA